jgi:hypothetical protein
VNLEWEAGSGEQGKRERGARIVVKIQKYKNSPKIEIFIDVNFFLNFNFSENLDLLPWV